MSRARTLFAAAVLTLGLAAPSAGWAMDRPYSLFDALGAGCSYEQIKKDHPRLSPLLPAGPGVYKAALAEEFPFSTMGPLSMPNAMFFFKSRDGSASEGQMGLVGVYSFLAIDEAKTPKEAETVWEYTGFSDWADNALTRGEKKEPVWVDGSRVIRLDTDQLEMGSGPVTTLGVWWGLADMDDLATVTLPGNEVKK